MKGRAAVALLAAGCSATWASAQVPASREFQINTYTTASQDRPVVASDGAGNFVVAWESYGQDGSGDGMFAQRYDALGQPRGGEFQVNTYTPPWQEGPALASDAVGNFVVVWESYGQDGSGRGVFAQRYDAAGQPRGGEFQVNTYTTDLQRAPSVALDAIGDFVVVWSGRGPSGWGVFGQRYDAAG